MAAHRRAGSGCARRRLALALLLAWTGCGEPARDSGPPEDARTATPPAAPATAAEPDPAPTASPRNLLLVTLDTTRADALVPYGQELPSSPAMQRMTREGVLFEQVASASPSTLPAHATLLTGLYPFAHGVRSNSGYRLPDASETLAERLRARGYRTGAEIASTVLDASRGLAQGFDHYRDLRSPDVERIRTRTAAGEIELDERPAADVTRFARRFLDAPRGEPFFLWLHYFDPHLFYVRRPEIARLLPGDDGYLAEVRYTDDQIGALLAHLEARGLRERTLVMLVADHGEGRGEHGESTHAYFVYESTIRVPLLLWGPAELPAGRRVDGLVRTIDLLPTALDWLGLPVPADLPGSSLLPRLSGSAPAAEERSAYGESIEFARVFEGMPLRYLRRGDWKYIHAPEPELYRLSEDPHELHNLADRQPERVAALRAELEALVRGASPRADASAAISPGERERLSALGYVVPEEGGPTRERLASLAPHGPPPGELIADVETAVNAVGQLRLGRAAEAEPVLARLVERHPRSPTLLRDHAEALLALGRAAEARAALARAVEASECGAAARVQLAELLRAADEREAQHAVLREGVERCGEGSAELLNNFAWVLATSPIQDLRDGDRAEQLARRALALFGGDAPEILDTLAAAQAERGDFAGARATLTRAIRQARSQGRPPALVAMLERSLATVRAGQPVRDP
jgi:arylsulfatase A-like enzyme